MWRTKKWEIQIQSFKLSALDRGVLKSHNVVQISSSSEQLDPARSGAFPYNLTEDGHIT